MASSSSSLPDPRSLPSSDTSATKHAWSQIVRGDAEASAKKPLQAPLVPNAERQQQQQQQQIPAISLVSTESEKTEVRVLMQTNAELGMAPLDSSNLIASALEDGDDIADARVFDEASANGEEAAAVSKAVADATESGVLNVVTADGTEASQNKPPKSSPVDAEPRVSRPTWRKPSSINTEGEGKPQPVMGAVAWPALAEARNMKASETRKSKPSGLKTPPTSPAMASSSVQESLSKVSLHSGDSSNSQPGIKHKPSFKGGLVGSGRPAFQPIENGSSSMEHPTLGAHGSEQSTKHNMHARTKGNFSGIPAMDHERVPHHRNDGMGPFPNNTRKWRNNNRDQGRGNYGWHHHGRPYENAGDMVTLLHEQRIGPRNMPRPHPLMNVNPTFYPVPNFQNGGVYYMPTGAPEFVHGPPYYAAMPPAAGVIHGPNPLALRSMLLQQIDYYFSIENLCRDVFLRIHMDEQGFVPVSVIARFNRIRKLSPNPMVILEALQQSAVVEVQHDRIRRRNDGGKWRLLPDHVNPGQENTAFVNSTEEDHSKLARADQGSDMGSVPSVEAANSGMGAESVMPLTDAESARLRPGRNNCIGGHVGLEERGAQCSSDDLDVLMVQHGSVVDMDASSQSHHSDFRVGRTEDTSLTGSDSAGCLSATPNCLQAGNELKSRDTAMHRQGNCPSDDIFLERSSMASQATVDEQSVSWKNSEGFWMENNAYFMHGDFEQDGSVPSNSNYMLKSHEDEEEDSVDVNDRDVQRLINVTHAPLGSFIAVP